MRAWRVEIKKRRRTCPLFYLLGSFWGYLAQALSANFNPSRGPDLGISVSSKYSP